LYFTAQEAVKAWQGYAFGREILGTPMDEEDGRNHYQKQALQSAQLREQMVEI